jgi:hypothetical protein
MGIHAEVAIKVVINILQNRNIFNQLFVNKNQTLNDYSDKIASQVPKYSKATKTKECPKETFLALCETGAVLGIPPGIYCRSEDNRKYALTALTILRKNCNYHYSPTELWQEVCQQLGILSKEHNQQMDIVLALWNEGFLR